MKYNTKIKFSIFSLLLILNIIATIYVKLFDVYTTNFKIVGSFIAIIFVSVITSIFQLKFYCFTLCFVFFASTLGSCVNLYQSVEIYDLFVHYLSGILLADGGRIIADYLFLKRNLSDDSFVKNLFAFFFSCACAAFWEIYEFTADQLTNIGMQGDNSNTMGDIVAGVSGTLSYLVVSVAVSIVKNRKNKNIKKISKKT